MTDTEAELVPPKLSSEVAAPADASDLALLFELDGKPYYIAKNPPASAVLRYMRSAREQGDTYAMQELLENLIGSDNYRALEACPTLTMEQWGVITSIASKYTIGLFQRATAESGNS